MPIIAFITVAGFFTAVVLCAIWWYVPKLQMRGLNIEDAKDRASLDFSVRPNGAVHQWRKDPPRKLSVGPGS